VPPFNATQLTRTSPEAVPVGLSIARVLVAVVFEIELTDSRVIPALGGGGVVLIVQVVVAGVASVLPAASVAWTLKV
jgi:hypothetical protein